VIALMSEHLPFLIAAYGLVWIGEPHANSCPLS